MRHPALDGPADADHTKACVRCGAQIPCFGELRLDEDGACCRSCASPEWCDACQAVADADRADDDDTEDTPQRRIA